LYGLIGQIKVAQGKRDELIAILVDGLKDMPGCLSYVVARDPNDDDAVWVTEVWDRQESHQASLSLPAVQDAISRGRPLIESFSARYETEPVGGYGLATT
jgi:quinol monooxygenase YgiN